MQGTEAEIKLHSFCAVVYKSVEWLFGTQCFDDRRFYNCAR